MSDINIDVTMGDTAIDVTITESQPINVTLETVLIHKPDKIYWNDIIDRPTYDDDYGTYVFP